MHLVFFFFLFCAHCFLIMYILLVIGGRFRTTADCSDLVKKIMCTTCRGHLEQLSLSLFLQAYHNLLYALSPDRSYSTLT